MLRAIGNFFFKYRNIIGPIAFILALVFGEPGYPVGNSSFNDLLALVGVMIGLLGQGIRILTIGYEYIERGGRNRQVYASKLVQGGVFAHCRNPLYFGNFLMCTGLALIIQSLAFYLILLPMVMFVYISIIAAEEDFLKTKFGQEYADYCNRVNRWWPRLFGWHQSLAGMQFNWRRVLIKEYNTLFVYAATLVMACVWAKYQVIGDTALPSKPFIITAFSVWLALYLFVRWTKKSGYVKA